MEKKQLQKNLGAAAALSTVVGMVIGGGVFFKPQAVYEITGGGPGLGMIAWILAGIMTITAGLTAAEVSAAIPKTGGMMVYIEEIYGKKLGFLTGWMQSVLFFPATIAAISVMFGQQAAILLGNESLVIPMTVGVILLIGVLNTFGSKTSGAIQTVSTVGKLLPLILIMIFGFIKGEGNNPIVQPMVAEGVSPMSIIGQLLIAVLFAYDGWINVGAIAGEMKNPGKDLPKAIVGGLSLVMGVYVVINLAYLWVLPASELAKYASPASAVAEAMMVAFGTASSSATLPLTIACCEKRGISHKIASFVLPLGATLNMDGTALLQTVAVIFLAQAYGVALTPFLIIEIAVLAIIASSTCAGIPGAGLITIALILNGMGLSPEQLVAGFAFLFTIERVTDMMRTLVNVTSDAVVVAAIADNENEINYDLLNNPAAYEDIA